VKLLRVAGVSVGTATSGGPVGVVAAGGLVGEAVGVMLVGVALGNGVTFGSGVTLVGSGVLVVGIGVEGGVAVIADATLPATPSAHNMIITPGLMLVGFTISTPTLLT
jgi:hypothetical protein